ncbi:CMRF35-like molecule 3 isoform X2 [Mauremys reevesii]|uniref:CMRF35-like molecule 3 isoform X2 n=1 Tax=Mauremys reevesii TaxID=260615 RepID=UPI00193F56FC|nr:CMRF35-like molecule 3 isoform X2 [Mauremys reevesii]
MPTGETRTRYFLVSQRKDYRYPQESTSHRAVGRGKTMRIFPILGWMLFPGCWAVTGPGAVRGPPGGSVAVRCRYRAGYGHYQKFWCRAGGWFCSDGIHIVETDGSEAEVTRGRVSIRDNHTQRAFTVTVENLTPADAGTYHCGVVRSGLLDLRDTVTLTVSPATSSPPPAERSSSATVQPPSSTSISTSICTTAEEGKSSFSTNQDTTALVAPQSNILLRILLPCVLLLLILFLLAAVMLVRLSKKRKKELSGASVQRDKNINLSNLGSEEVSYATVTISTPHQQPIYANVEQRPKTTRPAEPPEETLYSPVKLPPKH